MSNKEIYKALCETEGSAIPLFLQYWWMEAVCKGKQWDVLLVRDEDGKILGAMPYLIGKKLGMRYIVQPQLTQYNGPWFKYPDSPLSSREKVDFEMRVGAVFVEQLNQMKLSFYRQCFSPDVANWLPFHWAGYRQTTRYSYRLNLASGAEALFSNMRKDDRQKKIRKAGSLLHQVEVTPVEFAQMHIAYWRSKGQADLLSPAFIERAVSAALSRNQGLLLGLADDSDKVCGAAFAIYDDRCAYSLMAALSPDCTMKGVYDCLFWSLIKQLLGRSLEFDFEGSMDNGIGEFYRSFGATQVPYSQVTKFNNSLFRTMLNLRGIH